MPRRKRVANRNFKCGRAFVSHQPSIRTLLFFLKTLQNRPFHLSLPPSFSFLSLLSVMVHATALFAFVVLTASSALAAPQNAKRFLDYSVHEERGVLPPNWARSEVAALNKREADKENFILPFRINLAQNNVNKAHDILMDISDPQSPRYGDHLSPHEIAKLVRVIFFRRRCCS